MTTLTMRPYAGDVDLPAVTALLNACDATDHLDDNYSEEDLRAEFASPEIDVARDLALWEDEGQLVAFGQTHISQHTASATLVDGYLYWRVLPAARGGALEGELFAWGERRLREVGQERGLPAIMRSGTMDFDRYGCEVIERHGLAPIRYFYRMARPLNEPIPEVSLPEGFQLSYVRDQADMERWVDAFNLSFIDHWNHHPLTLETHRAWHLSPAYLAERDLIAVAPDGSVAAFAFCEVDQASNARNNRKVGYIRLLGTRRGYRGIGLGRAMLVAGMQRLRQDGMDTAKLGVDAENPTGALGLYESVGFARASTRIVYHKDL